MTPVNRSTQCAVRRFIVAAILALTSFEGSFACSVDGMYGVAFGQNVAESTLKVYEQTFAGVTHFWYPTTTNIEPFKNLIVGVTPKSRRVFMIYAELHGEKETLNRIIEQIKAILSNQNEKLTWRVLGNHHYGENVNFDVALYTIGDLVDGKPTHLLTYSCESYEWRKKVFEEAFPKQ